MASTPLELWGNTVVLLGTFDPSVAHPELLLKEGLIRGADLASMKVDLVIPDAVGLRFDWVNILVEKERIVASTTLPNPLPEPMRDFVLDLAEQMKKPRVTALGINTDHHFAAGDLTGWHKIGHTLAPKEVIWDKVTKNPGTLAVQIQSEREDDFKGFIRTLVQPSVKIANGIYVQVNNHYEAPGDQFVDILNDEWVTALSYAKKIIEAVKALESSQE